MPPLWPCMECRSARTVLSVGGACRRNPPRLLGCSRRRRLRTFARALSLRTSVAELTAPVGGSLPTGAEEGECRESTRVGRIISLSVSEAVQMWHRSKRLPRRTTPRALACWMTMTTMKTRQWGVESHFEKYHRNIPRMAKGAPRTFQKLREHTLPLLPYHLSDCVGAGKYL